MIAQAKDTRDVVGAFASKIENRSLLFEKYVLAKTWGHDEPFQDANRFNVIRAASGGRRLLNEAAQKGYQRKVALELAQIQEDDASLVALRVKSSLTFLGLLEKSYPDRHRTFVGELGGRLLINLAGGVQENAGISLDRCFGMPLIPGSAAKGVSRHHALWQIKTCEDQLQRKDLLRRALLIFGFVGQDLKPGRNSTNWAWAVDDAPQILKDILRELHLQKDSTDFKGLISFLPASPASEKDLKIVAEGITPHTDQRTGGEATNPNPLAFPAVERGSQFAFCLILNRQINGLAKNDPNDLLNQAESWLKSAVTGTGIGAKTAAGYGWFTVDEEAAEKRRAEAEALMAAEKAKAEAIRLKEEQKQADEQEEQRLAGLETKIQEVAEQYAKLDNKAFSDLSKNVGSDALTEVELRAFFRELNSKARKDRRARWKKDGRWPSLVTVADQLNIELL